MGEINLYLTRVCIESKDLKAELTKENQNLKKKKKCEKISIFPFGAANFRIISKLSISVSMCFYVSL